MKVRVAVLAALFVALTGIAASIALIDGGWWAAGWLGYPIVGAAILWRSPRNAIGWLLVVIGVSWAISSFGLALLTLRPSLPGGVWIEMGTAILGYTAFLSMVLVTVVFPTGSPATAAGRVLRAFLVMLWVAVGAAELLDTSPKELTGVSSPLAAPALSIFSGWMLNSGFILVPIAILLALVGLITRWMRSKGIERLQYQWFCCALILVAVILIVFELIPGEADGISVVSALIVFNLIPLSIGIAVTRYRLYEIDRIVSRTVTYALVVGLLVGAFLGVVALMSSLLPEESSDLAVAGSTLVVVALFNPLRRRVQVEVDRRFNRQRYDAQRVMEGFAVSLRDRVDPEEVMNGWVGVVSSTMQPDAIGMWVRDEGEAPAVV
jgi:hypothetical protein